MGYSKDFAWVATVQRYEYCDTLGMNQTTGYVTRVDTPVDI